MVLMSLPEFRGQNVIATIDFDLKFTYVLAGWEVSAHDANILSDSMSHPDGINIPDGKYYLGDAGYACRTGVLPPFRKTRYHLNEFSSRNYPRNAQGLFNLRHSSLRVTLERAFGALKNRFKILDQKPFHPFPTQVKLVLACCILHNWILQWGFDELVPEEEEVDPDDVVSSGHGKSPRLKGNPNSLRRLSLSFFSAVNIHPKMHLVQICHLFWAHLLY